MGSVLLLLFCLVLLSSLSSSCVTKVFSGLFLFSLSSSCVSVTFLSCAFVFFVFVLCNQCFLCGLCCCYFSVLCFCLLCPSSCVTKVFCGSVLLLLFCLVLLSYLSSSCVTKVFCGVCVAVTFLSCAFVFFVFVLCNQGFLWGLCCCYFSVLCFCLLCCPV